MIGPGRQTQRKHRGSLLLPELVKRPAVAPDGAPRPRLQRAQSADPYGPSRSALPRTQSNGTTDLRQRGAAATPAGSQDSGALLRRPASGSHLWVHPKP